MNNGEVIKLTQNIRRQGMSAESASNYVQSLLIRINEHGFDADIIVRRKRGRPSLKAMFLSRQQELNL
jgi:hypothetical protein